MNKSFTLIEILVVIVIIGILSAFILVGLGSITNSATIARGKAFINSMDNSLLLARISQWKLDETGTTATTIDSWGTNTGTLTNFVFTDANSGWRTDCTSNYCLSFDGTNDYVDIIGSDVNTNNLAITGAITLSAWVKFRTVGIDGCIMGRGDWLGNGNYGYSLLKYGADNRIYFVTHSATTEDQQSSTFAIDDTSWHFVVANWDGTTDANGKKIYIDGLLRNQKTSTISSMGQPANTFKIGRRNNGTYHFPGLIDDARVYNQAMSASQIEQNYYIGLNKLYNNNNVSKQEYISKINELLAQNP